MFDDCAGRALCGVKFTDQFKGRIGIVDVVVAQFLALQLGCGGDPGPVRSVGVKRGRLVRVFAIAQGLGKRAGKGAPARRGNLDRVRHPCGHCRIVGGGPGIGDLRQFAPELGASGALVLIHVAQQLIVVFHIHHHSDKPMVFRCRADHCRPANVNVFDTFVIVGALGHRFFERVEVDHQEIDRPDPVLGHRARMVLIVAQCQEPSVHRRVQGFDTPIHHFRETGHLCNVFHLQPGVAHGLRRAAGGQKLDPALREAAGQIQQAGFIGNGNERAADGQVFGHSKIPKD